ncbi:GAF domain-containing protein [Streptomyces armeniacus]|uniref:GAF domain-containing protein n=1 Tax=Streptomyces armeniacus TaxID=83291 RepID=A0A345XK67_9ACTN|nr:GAF domain-containing protein [Streptomyces armeniacus]AXK32033.1 GAF domain-containing protein [Streptomyces armeniacus]
MRNPWLALEAGADPAERDGLLRRAHEEFLRGAPIAEPVRNVVADSWRRCAGALVRPESVARVDLAGAELSAFRAEHPLARVMPLIRELLGTIADDGAHLLSVCDETGRMLWVEGHPQVRRRAERMNFVAGAHWAERAVGTNAPGTSLALDHAVQIFAAEHYSRAVQSWTCAAAPVHDPHTGRLLGAVDITGGDHLAAPQSLALVQATARAAESQLARAGTGADGGTPLLQALGRDEAVLRGGRAAPVRLGRRHSEILLLLSAHPEGLTGERLSLELYGERDVNPVTLRAELSRLRQLLGPLLASRPYRLREPLGTDFAAVTDALDAADTGAALAAYRGPLLPLSEAPGIIRLRRTLEDRLRQRLLTVPRPELLETWVHSPWGEDDLDAWEALLAARPAHDPLRAPTAARVRALRRAFGLSETYATYTQRPHL